MCAGRRGRWRSVSATYFRLVCHRDGALQLGPESVDSTNKSVGVSIEVKRCRLDPHCAAESLTPASGATRPAVRVSLESFIPPEICRANEPDLHLSTRPSASAQHNFERNIRRQAPRGRNGSLGFGAARSVARDSSPASDRGDAVCDPRTDGWSPVGGVGRCDGGHKLVDGGGRAGLPRRRRTATSAATSPTPAF